MARTTNTEKAAARSARPAADPGGPQLGGVDLALAQGAGRDTERQLARMRLEKAIGALPLPWGSKQLDAPLARISKHLDELESSLLADPVTGPEPEYPRDNAIARAVVQVWPDHRTRPTMHEALRFLQLLEAAAYDCTLRRAGQEQRLRDTIETVVAQVEGAS